MRKLYDLAAAKTSREITRLYSTSFTWGIRALHPQLREPVYSIYGLVRVADEIVDTFFDVDQARMLDELEQATYQALERGMSVNPVLHAFQQTARRYGIDRPLLQAFFNSMRMDLSLQRHDADSFQQYIYGSAEVVGLMCLKVFCHGNEQLYEELAPQARKLGSAFQKVNFLRDLNSDYRQRGRMYFPGVSFEALNQQTLRALADDIENDFDAAIKGIRRLPPQARMGVYLAYLYFRSLLKKIRNSPPRKVQEQRIRITNFGKLWLWLQVCVRNSTGAL